MNAVLVTVVNGQKIIDSGTGIVLGSIAEENGSGDRTWVLTCAHTIRTVRSQNATNPIKIKVNGIDGAEIRDDLLAKYDLVVISLDAKIGNASHLGIPSVRPNVWCEGFTGFYQDHFWQRKVSGKVAGRIAALMGDGITLEYLRISPSLPGFAKGFSGGPVYEKDRVVAVLRILDSTETRKLGRKQLVCGYAISLSTEIIDLIREKLPPLLRIDSKRYPRQRRGATTSSLTDQAPPKAAPITVRDDLQKNRWGGTNEGFGNRLTVENVREYHHYFVFDAVLEQVEDTKPMQGPFIFHLHDTFDKSIVWIRKTDGKRAVLQAIEAIGTFTIGVQFRDSLKQWRSLEYDLVDYKNGRLKKYDR